MREVIMAVSEVIESLKTCELFDLLNEEEIRSLTDRLGTACSVETYSANRHVFNQGELSSGLYIVVGGQVLLQRLINIGNKEATWPLGILGRGRAMGWSALLYGPRYATASAICQKPGEILAIDGAALRSVLEQQPVIGYKVMERLACMLGERLKAAYNTMEAHL